MSEIRNFVHHHRGAGAPGDGPFGPAPPSRDDVAAYLLANRGLIRRRVIGRLRRAGILAVDPDDVTSSVLRRIDAAMVRRVVRTGSEREFWAYVIAVTDNATLARMRRARRERPWPRADGPDADDGHDRDDGGDEWLARRLTTCPTNDDAAAMVHDMVMALGDEQDRELLLWRLGGHPYRAIAAALGQSEAALRARWRRIGQYLRERFAPPPPPPSKHTHTRT